MRSVIEIGTVSENGKDFPLNCLFVKFKNTGSSAVLLNITESEISGYRLEIGETLELGGNGAEVKGSVYHYFVGGGARALTYVKETLISEN